MYHEGVALQQCRKQKHNMPGVSSDLYNLFQEDFFFFLGSHDFSLPQWKQYTVLVILLNFYGGTTAMSPK